MTIVTVLGALRDGRRNTGCRTQAIPVKDFRFAADSYVSIILTAGIL